MIGRRDIDHRLIGSTETPGVARELDVFLNLRSDVQHEDMRRQRALLPPLEVDATPGGCETSVALGFGQERTALAGLRMHRIFDGAGLWRSMNRGSKADLTHC
jgi:hypothetical protein